jgi:hypothetical protein
MAISTGTVGTHQVKSQLRSSLRRRRRRRPPEDDPVFGFPSPPEGFGFKKPPAVQRRQRARERRRRSRYRGPSYSDVMGDKRRRVS